MNINECRAGIVVVDEDTGRRGVIERVEKHPQNEASRSPFMVRVNFYGVDGMGELVNHEYISQIEDI